MKKLALTLLAVASLAACSSAPVANYGTSLPPRINLDVEKIHLIDRTVPNSDVSFKPSINEALHQWAVDRLGAVGRDGAALITVKDVSISTEALPMESGFSAWFTRQQGSKYVAHASIELAVRKGSETAFANAEASRWESMPEDPTAEERKQAYFTVLNGLMRDLGTNLETNMQEHLQNYVVAPAAKK